MSQVIQPVRNITEISGFWFVPFFFLNEDVDLLLKTRTKAKFWSGFSCRGLNPLLSSLSRKEFAGGHKNACRNHQAMEEKPLGCAFGKQLSEPRSRSGSSSSLCLFCRLKAAWQIGKLRGSELCLLCPRRKHLGCCRLAFIFSNKIDSPWGVSWDTGCSCWRATRIPGRATRAHSWSTESTLPLFQLAARESERLLTFPVPV